MAFRYWAHRWLVLAGACATAVNAQSDSARLHLVIAPVVDYTSFQQNAANVDQVGTQRDRREVRSFKLGADGTLSDGLGYTAVVSYKGFDRRTVTRPLRLDQVNVEVPVDGIGRVTIGKLPEPYSIEKLMSIHDLPQLERILDAFVPQRNIGMLIDGLTLHDRMTWHVSWANNGLGDNLHWSPTGQTVTTRLTALPWVRDTTAYVHAAVAWRYDGAVNDSIKYDARPESKVADNFVDTGEMPASHATESNAEFAASTGPLLAVSEYTLARVSSRALDVPQFSGYYTNVSYVVTGERRGYDRVAALPGKVTPKRRMGAVELFARFSHVNLDDNVVHGGVQQVGTFGVDWWRTAQWRVGAAYAYTWLARHGANGAMQNIHARTQWVY